MTYPSSPVPVASEPGGPDRDARIEVFAARGGLFWPLAVIPLGPARPDGLGGQVILRCTGQIRQLKVISPEGCLFSTPQPDDPLHDLNSVTGGMPGRTVATETVTFTLEFATGQSNNSLESAMRGSREEG